MVKPLRFSLLAAAAAHLAAFVFVAVGRLLYPFELEWIEGGLVDEVRAVLRGAALYGSPSARQVPFIYPPLYFYASAAVARLAGGGFLPLRLVSFASTAASLALVAVLARRGGAGWPGALLAAGAFAATFKIGGGWLTLARVDALSLALFLAGAYALLRAVRASARRPRGGVTPPLPFASGTDMSPRSLARVSRTILDHLASFSPLPLKGRGAGGVSITTRLRMTTRLRS